MRGGYCKELFSPLVVGYPTSKVHYIRTVRYNEQHEQEPNQSETDRVNGAKLIDDPSKTRTPYLMWRS